MSPDCVLDRPPRQDPRHELTEIDLEVHLELWVFLGNCTPGFGNGSGFSAALAMAYFSSRAFGYGNGTCLVVAPSTRLAMTTALFMAMVAPATRLAMATSLFVVMETPATHQAMATALTMAMIAPAARVVMSTAGYGNGSSGNTFSYGTFIGYGFGSSGLTSD